MLEEALNLKKLTINAKILKKLQSFYNLPTKEELYFKIGKNVIRLDNLHKILSDKSTNKWVRYWRLSFSKKSADGAGGIRARAPPKASSPTELLWTAVVIET